MWMVAANFRRTHSPIDWLGLRVYLSDTQLLQASLQVKDGGLGVRRVSSLALPAFLASAASTLPSRPTFLHNKRI